MSEYKPTEYVVDFGDCRSSRFVELSMALIEHNGAKLHEKIVRCKDCRFYAADELGEYCRLMNFEDIRCMANMFCAWGERPPALITEAENEERECTIVGAWDDYATKLEDERSELRQKADNLTAERDELKAFAERLETASRDKLGVTLFGVDYVTEEFMLHMRDTLTAEVDELNMRVNGLIGELGDTEGTALSLQAERDELRKQLAEKQHVCDVQRDSFLKLERECAELRRMLADAAEAI